MNSIGRRILMTTMFAAAATLTAAILVTSAVGTSMIIPAFAQGENDRWRKLYRRKYDRY